MTDPRLAKATPEQRERLARIDDPRQRETLLACIDRGEYIPDFAWRPLPLSQFLPLVDADRAIQGQVRRLREEAAERGETLLDALERGSRAGESR